MSIEQLVTKINTLEKRLAKLEKQEKGFAGIGARVYNSADISVADNTFQSLTFDSERFDTDSIHSTSTNTGRLTCNTAGKYIIVGNVLWDTNASGRRGLRIRANGASTIGFHQYENVPDSAINPVQIVTTIYALAIDDYVQLQAFQNSGGSLNITQADNYSPEFMMYLLP